MKLTLCVCVYMNSLKGVATLREEEKGEVEVLKKEDEVGRLSLIEVARTWEVAKGVLSLKNRTRRGERGTRHWVEKLGEGRRVDKTIRR
jgi:hypothetical protein